MTMYHLGGYYRRESDATLPASPAPSTASSRLKAQLSPYLYVVLLPVSIVCQALRTILSWIGEATLTVMHFGYRGHWLKFVLGFFAALSAGFHVIGIAVHAGILGPALLLATLATALFTFCLIWPAACALVCSMPSPARLHSLLLCLADAACPPIDATPATLPTRSVSPVALPPAPPAPKPLTLKEKMELLAQQSAELEAALESGAHAGESVADSAQLQRDLHRLRKSQEKISSHIEP